MERRKLKKIKILQVWKKRAKKVTKLILQKA